MTREKTYYRYLTSNRVISECCSIWNLYSILNANKDCELLHDEQKVQECDATMFNSHHEAWFKKKLLQTFVQ